MIAIAPTQKIKVADINPFANGGRLYFFSTLNTRSLSRLSISIHSPMITPITSEIIISKSLCVERLPFSITTKSLINHPRAKQVNPSPNVNIMDFCIFSDKPFLKIIPRKVATMIAAAFIIVPIYTSINDRESTSYLD